MINSISMRFTLASVSVAFLVLALIGSINYAFLKKELLRDATQKAQLIELNSIYKIQKIIEKTKMASEHVKLLLQYKGFKSESIEKILTTTLEKEFDFYGMSMAFEPHGIYRNEYCPYYYKKDHKILYRDLSKNNYNYLHKEWYLAPKNKKRAVWSEPYFDEGGGNILMATYGNPIIENGHFLGVLTIDLSLKKLQEIISSIHILDSGYAFLLSKNYTILVDPDKNKIMQKYYKKSIEYNRIIKEENKWIYYSHIPSTHLTLGIVLPHKELFASLHKISLLSIILAVIGSILLIFTMILISRRITKPLQEVTYLTHEISLGNFDKKLALQITHDEIYDLSCSINRMQDAIKSYIEELKEATIKQQKIDSELEIAKAIQLSMLPHIKAKDEKVALEALLRAARAVGGDFYDLIYRDENEICFVIADVSGKGVPAAMFMAVTISYIRAYATTGLSPKQIVHTLNNSVAKNNDENLFVTLFLATLNLKSGELNYVNAGHNPPYILRNNNTIEALPISGNIVVGAFENASYREEKIILNKGEGIFLYTDGVNEAFSKEGEEFGMQRLAVLLEKSVNEEAHEIIDSFDKALKEFTKGAEQSDDITMFVVKRKAS